MTARMKYAESMAAEIAVQLGIQDRAGIDLIDLLGGRPLGFICPEDQPQCWLEPVVTPWAAVAAIVEELGLQASSDLLMPVESQNLGAVMTAALGSGPVVLGPLQPSILAPDPWAKFHSGAAAFATVRAIEPQTSVVTLCVPSGWPMRKVPLVLLQRAVRDCPHPGGLIRLHPLGDNQWRAGAWRCVLDRLGVDTWSAGAAALDRLAHGFAHGRQGRRHLPSLHVGLRNLQQAVGIAARTLAQPPAPVPKSEYGAAWRYAAWFERGHQACAELLADLPARSPAALSDGLARIAAWAGRS